MEETDFPLHLLLLFYLGHRAFYRFFQENIRRKGVDLEECIQIGLKNAGAGDLKNGYRSGGAQIKEAQSYYYPFEFDRRLHPFHGQKS